MTKIQSLVGEINDDQNTLSADFDKLHALKAAAKKEAKEKAESAAAAASTTAAPRETTEAAETSAAAETSEAAPETSEAAETTEAAETSAAAETSEAAPETSEASASDDTKAPMMLLAVDSEPSLALSWVVLFGSLSMAGFYFAYRRLNGKMNMSELRPLLKKDEYFQGEYAA